MVSFDNENSEIPLTTTEKSHEDIWWKNGVIYHIYPRSFYDSNGDGIGDIPGITSKLDYLQDLGIDVIWLSPIYQSPQIDFGYDVSDYREVDESYGTKDDFTQLLHEAHKRGIKIIMDMILNHTSDKHRWFIESQSSLDNDKRDWYIWKSPINNKPPTNWKTAFGKSAWHFDEKTSQYYYHSFFTEQPDLNWRNDNVKKAFFEEIKYWLDLGVDGFRLDVINYIAKDKKFRNNPWLFQQLLTKSKVYTRDRNKSIRIVKSLRKLLDMYDERMCVGEIYTLPPGNSELSAKYLGDGNDALHLAFDFSLIFAQWSAKKYANVLLNSYYHIPEDGWACHVFSNHDLGRNSIKTFLLKNHKAKAKLIAMMHLTLRGTPFIYYGEEIGMQNSSIPYKKIRDRLGRMYWPFYSGRDKARTPMQWNREKYAGFSITKPWLPVDKEYKKVNVEKQLSRENSILNFYKKIIQLRKEQKTLQNGDWQLIENPGKHILAYSRTYNSETLHIYLNFKNSQKVINGNPPFETLLSTYTETQEASDRLILRPYEGILVKVR